MSEEIAEDYEKLCECFDPVLEKADIMLEKIESIYKASIPIVATDYKESLVKDANELERDYKTAKRRYELVKTGSYFFREINKEIEEVLEKHNKNIKRMKKLISDIKT